MESILQNSTLIRLKLERCLCSGHFVGNTFTDAHRNMQDVFVSLIVRCIVRIVRYSFV